MNEREMSFIMHTPEGDVTMQVLFTFHSEETNANFMLYTPDDLDSGKPVSLAACRYDPDDLTKILPLQGDMDRDVVQSFINYISTTPRAEPEKSAPKKNSKKRKIPLDIFPIFVIIQKLSDSEPNMGV